MEPGRKHLPRGVRALQLPRDPHANLRRDAAVRTWRGRGHRHRLKRDVYLGGPRTRAEREKPVSYLATGEHSRRGACIHRAQTGRDWKVAEALLHWPAVSPRASAKGPLPPVLPNWRRGDWATLGRQRIAGARCRNTGDACHTP